MAISSYPFENQDTTEDQYTELFREFQDDGIADSANGTGLKVVATGGLSVAIQPGFAILRGHGIKSTAVENVAVASSAQEVRHRIILKLDPASDGITIEVKAGTPGAGAPPALTRTDYGVLEFPLATITVPAGAAGIGNGAIEDTRRFLGSNVSVWDGNVGRPDNPRTGRLGYNQTLDRFEYFDGASWKKANGQASHIQYGRAFVPISSNDVWGNADVTFQEPFSSTPRVSLTHVLQDAQPNQSFLGIGDDMTTKSKLRIRGKRPPGEGSAGITVDWIAIGEKE